MLKFKIYFLFITVLISCASSSEELIEEENPTVLTITNGMTFTEINKILYAASSGVIVEVAPGTYTISGELALKGGTVLKGQSSIKPVFTAWESSNSEMLEQNWDSNKSAATISGIEFKNIRFHISNAKNLSFKDCVFDDGRRKSGTNKTFTQDAYIQVYKCDNIVIEESVFKRRVGNSGRGIYTVASSNTKISNNRFGNGGSEGYFVTAINDNSDGTHITGNTISRNVSWVATDETDHGIYVHSFKYVTIENNTISGWPSNSSGGALKIRNGEGGLIENNSMTTSGILMYVYKNTPKHPFLKDIQILNNKISIANPVDDIYHGIGYWRDTQEAGFYEESILISGNELPMGTIKISNPIDVLLFNKNGGGVFKNDVDILNLAAGIKNSENY